MPHSERLGSSRRAGLREVSVEVGLEARELGVAGIEIVRAWVAAVGYDTIRETGDI